MPHTVLANQIWENPNGNRKQPIRIKPLWKCARKQFQGVQINIMPTLPNYRRESPEYYTDINIMPTLPNYRRESPEYYTDLLLSRTRHQISWINFMCLSLNFSPFFSQNSNFFYLLYSFRDTFAHIRSLTKIISSLRWWKQILTVCTSCKTSYIDWSQFLCHNLPVAVVAVHWHSWKGGCGGKAKESLQILDLQRLASLRV